MRPQCVNCRYREQNGRMQSQRGRLGRRKYYCRHPAAAVLVDRYGRHVSNFIGFGDLSEESPLQLKSCKSWCPLKEETAK